MKIGLPDGTVAEFPDGTPKEVMTKAIQSYLMKSSAEAGIKRATTEAETRSKTPDPMSPEGFYGGRGEMGELVTPEHANMQALVGATTLAAGATLPGLAAAPVASIAGMAASLPTSYYGGKVAGNLGLPPWIGNLAGGMVGGITPALLSRKVIGALVAAHAAKSGGAPVMAALENALVESGWAPQQAKAFATAMGSGGATAPAAAAPAMEAMVPVSGEQLPPYVAGLAASAKAAPAVASAAPAVTEAALPATLSQQQLKLVAQLRGLAQNNPADKIKIAQAAQEMFPNSWQEVLKMIMAKNTKLPTILVP